MLAADYKVYAWTSVRPEAVSADNPYGQTREIMCARSWNEVRLFSGATTARLHSGKISRDRTEIEIAFQARGQVFWRPLHPHTALFVRQEPRHA